MTTTQKVLIITTLAAAVGTGIYEAREASTLRTELRNLQQQNSQLATQCEQLTRECDDALSRSAASGDPAQSPLSASLPPEQMRELIQLRGEVGRLRSQEREIERLRQEQMQMAAIKVPHAQAEFDRLTNLHAENNVSAQQLGQAKFALESLKAEANGNGARAAQLRFEQAEAELAKISQLYQQKLVGESEYNKAKHAVDLRRAELRGDAVEVRHIQLRDAEEELARAAELRRQSLISEGEYNKALLRVELLRGRTGR
jgi:hypothetical protein